MDQIVVSDIPLPGEDAPPKANEKNQENVQEQVLNHEQITETLDAATNLQSDIEKTVKQSMEVGESTISDNEADKIAEEFIRDITANDSIEIKNNAVSETVHELQAEVEQAVAKSDMPEVNILEVSQNSDSQILTVVETMESLPCSVSTDNCKISTDDVTAEIVNEEITAHTIEISEPLIEEESVSYVTAENKLEDEQPPKKSSRTNSTIEAIKNDWSDTLTIEEINEEVIENKKSQATEPIIIEPDKNDTESEVTEVVVLETAHEDIDEVTENITIEIIDNSHISNNEVVIETATAEQSLIKEDTEEEQTKNIGESVESRIQSSKDTDTDNLLFLSEVIDKPSGKRENKEEKPEEFKKEIIIAEEEAGSNNNPSQNKQPKPRGRPPKNAIQRESDNLPIPCHVLGRNVENPTEDLISNGRTPPKPRLGVKVPYRFLTSQIVSKEEIANELVALTNKRNPDPDPPAGGDIFFASKLTQRLANKIAMNVNKKKHSNEASSNTDTKPIENDSKTVESTSGIPTEALTSTAATSTDQTTSKNKQNTITNNSDLLAILEGDVDVDWTKDISNSKANESSTEIKSSNGNKTIEIQQINDNNMEPKSKKILDPAMERQIALKQLRELPKLKYSGRGRPRKYDLKPIVKSHMTAKTELSSNKSLPEIKKPEKQIGKNETNENIKQVVNKLASKIMENVKNFDMEMDNDLSLTPKRVTKTYSRKEAVLDVPADLECIVNDTELNSALQDAVDDAKYTVEENKNESNSVDGKKTIESSSKQKKVQVEKEKEINQGKIQSQKKQKRLSTEISKPEITLVSKRARVIKKKVIWDPAEVPKTKVLNAIRRAQVQELKAKKEKIKQLRTENETTEDEDEETKDYQKTENKNMHDKVNQYEQKKEVKETKNKEVRQLRKKIVPRTNLTKVQKKKLLITRPLRSLTGKLIRSTNIELKSSITLSKKKKQVMAEIAKSVRNKPKKTELDKLLGDEGAVNMLYSVKNKGKIPQKTYLSQKELQNRKKQLRDVITQSSSQEDKTKALRKKDSPPLPPIQLPARKKSRDSVRSSLQSPPPSPSFYPHSRAEASRIIRRHSSSFSSDCSSPRRLSVDQLQSNDKQQNKIETSDESAKVDFQTPVRVLRRKNDVKTEEKINKTDRDKLTPAEKRKLNVEMIKNFDKHPKKRTRSSKGEEVETEIQSNEKTEVKSKTRFTVVQTDYKELILKNMNNFYQIIMNPPSNAKLRDVISLQMFQELSSLITKLSKNDDCKVVAIISNGKYFCNGLDFSHLIQTTAEKRSTAAQEMSKALKNFVMSIAKFPKPLLVSLHSSASFFGCTMLPYFDVVIAAETATLSADYTRMGHCPEGGAHLTLSPKNATELLILGRKFTAKDALDKGLINIVEKKEKLEETLIKIALEMSEKNQQSLTSTKSLLRQSLLQKLDDAIDCEQKLLVELWPNSVCQQHFKKLLTEQELW